MYKYVNSNVMESLQIIPTQIFARKEVGNEGNTKKKKFKVRIKHKARGKDVSALYRNLLCYLPKENPSDP